MKVAKVVFSYRSDDGLSHKNTENRISFLRIAQQCSEVKTLKCSILCDFAHIYLLLFPEVNCRGHENLL